MMGAYPKEEIVGTASQPKRAAVSFPPIWQKERGVSTKKGTIHFLHISRGSAYELETHLKVPS